VNAASDLERFLRLPQAMQKKVAAEGLEKRIQEIAGRAADNYLQKAVRVLGSAPTRKAAIAARVLAPFEKRLNDLGFFPASDALERIQRSAEECVTQILLAA
jgi:hypothetical protein